MIGRLEYLWLASGSPRRLLLINQAGGSSPMRCVPAGRRRDAEARRAAARLRHAAGAAEGRSRAHHGAHRRGIARLPASWPPTRWLRSGGAFCRKRTCSTRRRSACGLLPGRNHRVHTSVCLVTPKETFRQRHIETRVRFKRLSDQDIEAYLASGEWRRYKAGGYAAQGIAGSFIVKIVGSYSSIVGLPLYENCHDAPQAARGLSGSHFGWLNAPGGEGGGAALRPIFYPCLPPQTAPSAQSAASPATQRSSRSARNAAPTSTCTAGCPAAMRSRPPKTRRRTSAGEEYRRRRAAMKRCPSS